MHAAGRRMLLFSANNVVNGWRKHVNFVTVRGATLAAASSRTSSANTTTNGVAVALFSTSAPPKHKGSMKNINISSSSSSSSNNAGNSRSTKSRSSIDDKAPLLNEHLIAELFNKMRGGVLGRGEEISADTYQVRLIVDRGRSIHDKDSVKTNTSSSGSSSSSTNIIINNRVGEKKNDIHNQEVDGDDVDSNDDEEADDDDDDEEYDDSDKLSSSPTKSSPLSSQSSQVTTLNRAISIAHEYELDLMEVTLQVHPPVIKAVNYEKYAYEQKRKQSKIASSKKKKGGGGAISDRPVKEYKFRAGIADHDLNRKTRDMLEYLEAGHAVRVTLTARQRSLNEDGNAITTTLERVKELLGDKAVEARGMKANDRNSYGSLLFHPNTKR